MNFNQLVLEKLDYSIQESGLRLVEERQNYMKFQTNYLVIVISHNPLENSNTLWFGENNENLNVIEIDNQILSSFFGSDLRLDEVSTEIFLNNLVSFLSNEAKSLLQGDLKKLTELESFDQKRGDEHTQALLRSQNLDIADKAWKEENYEGFTQYIDQIGKEGLAKSYQLKYEIALHKKD